MRRAHASVAARLLLVVGILASALAYTEGPYKLQEPWAGYWWPWYNRHEDSLHLWQGGGGIYGDTPGPIYNHDTRYFWLPESIRDSAQLWEIASHYRTWPSTAGHCRGVTCASILEPDTLPADCGALSQDDLEGLLAEIYEDCWLYIQTTAGCPAKPGDVWLSLREWLKVQPNHAPKVLAANLDTAFVEYFAVYGYNIDGDVIDDTLFDGVMTLYYEDHKYGVLHAPESAWYRFQCNVTGPDTHPVPDKEQGTWVECHGPFGINSPPNYFCTAESLDREVRGRNPYVCDEDMAGYDRLKRVIDHKTIILDDAYMDYAYPVDPPGGIWERRPGYAESCWATLSTWEDHPYYRVHWNPRLGIGGLWEVSLYKTEPVAGEELNDSVHVRFQDNNAWLDQGCPPYNCWVPLDTWATSNLSAYVFVCNLEGDNWPFYTYFDAVKLEYVGGGGDGGASAATVALGGEGTRVRVAPSPVRRTARISYTVPNPGPVDVVVYDVMGRAVLRVPQNVQRAGPQNATISLDGLPAGAYIARVNAGGEHSTCRFVMCR